MCELKYRGLVTVCGLSFGDFIFLEALSLFSDHHGEFHGRPRSDTVEPSPVRVIWDMAVDERSMDGHTESSNNYKQDTYLN